ncbi:MAG: hypothetical protein K8R37_09980 [Bacteroidales bacterium]|nr:hypothetical protein [Bacteroidales bacterium]
MEELLPIIIGIIWLAYTIYSKGQKKKHAKNPQPSGEKEKSGASFLEQILLGEESPHPQPYESFIEPIENEPERVEVYEEEVKKQEPQPFLREELSDFLQEGQRVSFKKEEFSYIDIEEKSEIKKYIEDFNLRKAVIYSEILNAPYI